MPKTLSEEEVSQLIKTAGEAGTNESVRLVCLLEMLYATGLRVSELVGLPMAAVGENTEFLMVEGKGGRERMIPLSEPAQNAINKYLGIREQFIGNENQAAQEKSFFPSKNI